MNSQNGYRRMQTDTTSSVRQVSPQRYTYKSLITKRPTFRSQLMLIVLTVLVFSIIVTVINVYQLRLLQGDLRVPPEARDEALTDRPIVWVNGKRIGSGYLQHILNVFERLGYEYVTGDDQTVWDVLWSHEYPFVTLKPYLSRLTPHQKVNHFPGSGYLTNKQTLVSSKTRLSFIPRAFQIPRDKKSFLEYAEENPDKKWVQKSKNHRGVKIKKVHELALNEQGTFIQEYIDSPYLIDGRRFDIGIYTTITSINPLRVYIYEGDWLIRFCPEQYYPFDESVILKYVVTDSYMPVWEVPSLKKYYTDLGYNRKESLFAKMRNDGRNPEWLAEKLQDAIRMTVLEKEPQLIRSASNYKSTKNFFEMVRFDFVLDDQLNIYLMEVNMSPNLSTSHFSLNRLLYEQVVFSMLNLVGVGKPTEYFFTQGCYHKRFTLWMTSPAELVPLVVSLDRIHCTMKLVLWPPALRHHLCSATTHAEKLVPTFNPWDIYKESFDTSAPEREMLVSSRDVQTFVSLCSSSTCIDNCRAVECKLCQDCLKADQTDTLENAYLEHNNRLTWRRVVPKPFQSQAAAKSWTEEKDEYFQKLSPTNQWMDAWFRGKCLSDATWCM